MESIWSKTEKLPERKPLTGNISTQAAVIGGGMAGILTAYQLRRRGIETVVLEANRIGSGQTQNTTAKITSQHGLIYDRLLRQFGEGRAKEYAQANENAVNEYERLVREQNIACMFERRPAVLYTESQAERLKREREAARRLGIDAELCTVSELPVPSSCALRFERQAQFHPLMFLKALSQEVPVFEHTKALRVYPNQIVTDRGKVEARHIVFATHYPFPNIPGFYFIRMHQERSYVLALDGAPALNAMYYGVDRNGLSFRNAGKLLLLGGGNHRTGEARQDSAYQELWRKARMFWPECRGVAAYSAQDCMTLDGVPYVGHFSPARPDWYLATGFGKWGMTGSMAAALLLSEKIAGQRKKDRTVFSPRRFVPSAALPNLMKDGMKSGKGLLKEILYLPGKEFDRIPKGQGAIIRHCSKKRGAYKDRDGAVYLVSTRCPHLGCQLEWNQDEQSWDCPCHGSRFDFRGNLLDGPAQTNLPGFEEIKKSDS